MKRFLLITIPLALLGCSSSPAGPSPSKIAANLKAKNDLVAKLKAMSPTERSQYMKAHGAEVTSVMFSVKPKG